MQGIIDFVAYIIETQGIIGAVVLALCVIVYRQQEQSKRDNEVVKAMVENQKIESNQQKDMLDILMVHVTNQAATKQAIEDANKQSAEDRSKVQEALKASTKVIEAQNTVMETIQKKLAELVATIALLPNNEELLQGILRLTGELKVSVDALAQSQKKKTQELAAATPQEKTE